MSKFPGHIDYGRATIAGNRWTVVTLTFDRDTYEGSVAKCTSYIDGLADGAGQLVEITGSLSTKANLTVGHKRVSETLFISNSKDTFGSKKMFSPPRSALQ